MDNVLTKILEEHKQDNGTLINLLQMIQDAYGYITEESVYWFSDKLNIPASRFYGVITFYTKFRTKPTGKNILTVCCGAACHIKGADAILDSVRGALSLAEGEDTTTDLKFTVEKATCIGACSIAPVALLNNQVHALMDPGKAAKLVREYEGKEFIGHL